MILLFQVEDPSLNPTLRLVLLTLFFVGMSLVVLLRFYMFFEQRYALKYKKPFFLNTIVYSNELSREQLNILKNDFPFYNRLTGKDQILFQYRVSTFIVTKEFIGREGLNPSDEMKVLIASTAIMLTFGFRRYLIDIIETVIIYPESYYSNINEAYHKGETNPQLKIIVFSWEDFRLGYKIGDDNLNLGIHEFGHAIHLNAFVNNDISSLIFKKGFEDLTNYLQNNKTVREDLIASKYFRAYAYTNEYEFMAVLIECFIETPDEFKSKFPKIYGFVKEMLNFNFADY